MQLHIPTSADNLDTVQLIIDMRKVLKVLHLAKSSIMHEWAFLSCHSSLPAGAL